MATNTFSGTASDTALSIGALSRCTGCNVETIRYYERIGIMPEPARTAGGHRQYDQGHVRRLSFIRRSRALGFSPDTVRELLSFVDGGEWTCEDVQAMTLAHLGETRRKIADLRKIERVLADMAAECEGGTVPDCPIIEALFEGASPAAEPAP